MDELFGVSMNVIMVGLLALLLPALAWVAVLAWRNPIMVKKMTAVAPLPVSDGPHPHGSSNAPGRV